ncbi:hypothetical protein HPP92_005455 [Vanilla planifolia]|uniref:Uncharacterized protein n=1 Tax=Vanilla planifolia TaxID=51239 RepID=A0A835RTK2_VANPL|nr:hypothetical protein HPP92_005455 [Vanilla planifolia]
MDLSGGPPLKLQQDIELQDLWVPVTPAKTTSTKNNESFNPKLWPPLRPKLARSFGGSLHRSSECTPTMGTCIPEWGSNSSLLGNCSARSCSGNCRGLCNGSRDTCFMLNSPSIDVPTWDQSVGLLSSLNNLVRNLASVGEIPHFAPSSHTDCG